MTRALMGISEAFYIPTALALITQYHPRTTRSRAVSLHQMGIYCGVILGGFSGYAADNPRIGWRGLFGLCGVIGILYAIPLFFLLKNHPGNPSEANGRDSEGQSNLGIGASLRELFSNGAFLLLVLYFTLPAIPAWIIRDWMPAILKKQYDISQGLAGVSATVYLQIAAIVGAVVGGYWADRWMRSSEKGRIYVSAIGISLVVPAMFGAGYAPSTGSLAMAVGFLILFGIGWGFFDCNNMPILCQLVRPQLRGTGYGIMNLVSISCGGLGDWAFGRLEDMHVPLLAVFASFASFAIVSVFLVLSIRPRYREPLSSDPSNPS
jgi:MFS transporter, Spinster family, sphingosine-1-phosphate transporter